MTDCRNEPSASQQLDQNGDRVMTAAFLLEQKTCCKNSCRNCPYGFYDTKKPSKGEHMHTYPLRVDFCALDRGGDVYHPRYLNYLDRARVLMFEHGGAETPALFKNGLKWRVKSCSMQFHRELNWQDFGQVRTEITYIGKTEFSCKQWLVSAESAEKLEKTSAENATFFANTEIELCSLDGTSAKEIPEDFLKVLELHKN